MIVERTAKCHKEHGKYEGMIFSFNVRIRRTSKEARGALKGKDYLFI